MKEAEIKKIFEVPLLVSVIEKLKGLERYLLFKEDLNLSINQMVCQCENTKEPKITMECGHQLCPLCAGCIKKNANLKCKECNQILKTSIYSFIIKQIRNS